jgi:hypothetical protein
MVNGFSCRKLITGRCRLGVFTAMRLCMLGPNAKLITLSLPNLLKSRIIN